MTLRPYHASDAPALEAFLRGHLETSMFPLSNLFYGGRPTQSWVVDRGGVIGGYLGQADNGNLMPQWPGGDWAKATPLLAGRKVAGVLGPADQCDALLSALGLGSCPMSLSDVQQGLSLSLCDLRLPDAGGVELRKMRGEDAALVTEWRSGANTEVFGLPAPQARAQAEGEVAAMIKGGRHYLLWQGDVALSMAGVNAALPGIVQLGAVYTPPPLRRRGYAQGVVGLMLAELARGGVARAVLFAANQTAVGTYLALGFQPSHRFGIHLFENPGVVACP